MNYAPKLAQDRAGAPMQGYPAPYTAKVTTAGAPPATSSVISFGSNTTAVEITALNASLAIKWGCKDNNPSVIGSGATANFDHIVPVNQTRVFVIPTSVYGASSSVVGANFQNGLYSTMAVIATTSVLTGVTEY